MSDKKQTFDLQTLQPKNISEIAKWEQSQRELVKQNPFIKVSSNETYQEAKRRRTALRTGRTTIEKTDKEAGTFVRQFRDRIKQFATDMVAITLTHEDNQQREIDKWEEILERNKVQKERENEERIDKIKTKISEVEKKFDEIIESASSENLAEKQVEMENYFLNEKKDFKFEEYEFFVDEKHNEKQSELSDHVATLIKEDNEKKQREKMESENKLNGIIIEAQRVIDDFDSGSEIDLSEAVDSVFEKLENFDFGNLKEKFISERNRFKTKSTDHLLLLKAKKNDEEINEVKGFFSELTNKISMSEPVDFEKDVKHIQRNIEARTFNENSKVISEDLIFKLNSLIETKRISVERFIKNEKEALELRTSERKKEILSIGFVDSREGFFSLNDTFHVLVEQIDDQTDEEWNEYTSGIKTSVEAFKNKAERQDRLKVDKQSVLLWLDKLSFEISDYLEFDGKIENEELKSFPKEAIDKIQAEILNQKSLIEKF